MTSCIALLIDPADRQGYAGRELDDESQARVADALRAIWPTQSLVEDRSLHATDARRLQAMPLADVGTVFVVRPAAALLPASVLRRALDTANERSLDVATLADVAPEIAYIASRRAIELVAALGGVPGCTTLPQALNRLEVAGAALDDDAIRIGTVPGLESESATLPLVNSAALWEEPQLATLLSMSSESRLGEVRRLHHQAFNDARAQLQRLGGVRPRAARGVHKEALVVAPSMYQSGAHAAWTELAPYLSPSQVAFVVGRGTALGRVLQARGFTVFEVSDGLDARSAPDAAAFLAALDVARPAVVHFDGAEGSAWAGTVYARGTAIVQHVRLNDVERFRAAFVYADAAVGVSPHVCRDIEARMGTSLRVEHVPDGVCLQSRPPRASAGTDDVLVNPAKPVLCLCIGRVEPAKGQLRVLDIFRSLRAIRPARLIIVGPCGRDPAYCDEVRDRLASDYDDGDVSWEPFRHEMRELYERADVVLVGSRNEALGMVGLEALAAGCLLVAQRSTGYESIIDETNKEGLLFEPGEPASAVAARIVDALGECPVYARNGRAKVESRFDARDVARQLSQLWSEIASAS